MRALPVPQVSGARPQQGRPRQRHDRGLSEPGPVKRRGFSPDTIAGLKRAYKTLYRKGLGLEEAVNDLKAQVGTCPEVQQLLDFLDRSKRGIIR